MIRLAPIALAVFFLFSGCSSTKEVHQQSFAKLRNERDFERDFPTVWNGIEVAVRNLKVINRDPENVSPVELKNLTERSIETDWVYGRSEDKFIKYTVNDLPKKQYLKTRYKYVLTAKAKIGAINVVVELQEQVEILNDDGTSAGYEASKAPDSRKAFNMLDRINNSMLAAG